SAGKAPASTASKLPRPRRIDRWRKGSQEDTLADGEEEARDTRCESYSSYIYKGVHPDTGISKKAMAILKSFVNNIFKHIATEPSSTCHVGLRLSHSVFMLITSINFVLQDQI
ncbi:uncharacterized protein LACBIDRAFT_149405, partial [Laccaria bicolor S238N-H82]